MPKSIESNLQVGGDGPPLLLLHGCPQTHVMWWKIAEPLADAYRVPKNPVVPGSKPPKSNLAIATAWKIKSLITCPKADAKFAIGQAIKACGHAWAGEDKARKVLVSTDYGLTWKKTRAFGN